MLVAILGDFHYPERSSRLELLEELEKANPDLIIGTGDYTVRKVIDKLEGVAKFKGVKGNVDSGEIDLPKTIFFELKGFKVAVFHSKEIYPRGDLHAIYSFWKEQNPDFIIFGHTHKPCFSFIHDCYLINPGSFNGVVSGDGSKAFPSFAILEIEKGDFKVNFINKTK